MRKTATVLASQSSGTGVHCKLTQRKDGRFRVRWTDSAKRTGESTHKTREDADAAMSDVWARISAGFSGVHPAGSFGALGDEAMRRDHRHWANYGDRAWNDLDRLWKNRIAPMIAHKNAARVTVVDIEDVFAELGRLGYKQSTFSKARKILKHITDVGVSEGVWPEIRNPMKGLNRKTVRSANGGSDDIRFELDKTPTPDEVDALLAAAWKVDERIGFAMTIAARCGLRWSEVTNLKPEDFDFTKGKERLFVSKSKTRAGIRWVPIGPDTVKAVKPTVNKTKTGKFIVVTKFGNQLARANAQYLIDAARIMSNYPEHRGSFHYLRHFYGWSMLSAGAPIVDVSRVMGHASTAVTLSTYADAENLSAADSVARFSR